MPAHDPYAALRHAPYRRFLTGAQLMFLGNQSITIALGFHLYRITNSAWTLALIGLFTYLPVLLFSLPAGLMADHVQRRLIMRVTLALQCACALGFAGLSVYGGPLAAWYGLIFLWATARAVQTPASVSFYPTLMSEEAVPNAVTWNSANFQVAAVFGPALGGLLIDHIGLTSAFLFAAIGHAFYFVLLFGVKPLRPRVRKSNEASGLTQVKEGLRFVYTQKPILAALTLDLFAVLFGGVEGVMPIFARDILHCDATGLGLLRAAPFAGAFFMGLYFAHRPMTNAGPMMLKAVAVFGLSMIVFALSHSLVLSLLALALSGAMDNVSVVVRQTLVQVTTPDELRGRVQSVNFLFIGSSNELGEFESGVTAAAMGAVPSVIFGGVCVLFVVAGVAWKWPQLRQLRSLR